MDIESKEFLKWLAQERGIRENKEPQALTELQLQQLAKLDIEDRLFVAILLNSKQTVADLLKVGADPNATNKKGTTILELAFAFQRKDIAELLLEYGAQPSLITKKPKSKN